MTWKWAVGLAVLTSVVAGGCDREVKRVVVQGEVTYRGQPVREGELRLFPKPGTESPMSGAVIRDGRYVANGLGGVPVGTFRAEITAYRSPRVVDADIEKQDSSGQFLPERFNAASTLELTVPKSAEPITHDFRLE